MERETIPNLPAEVWIRNTYDEAHELCAVANATWVGTRDSAAPEGEWAGWRILRHLSRDGVFAVVDSRSATAPGSAWRREWSRE